eukprot:6213477-Pleurochrysis_carterae.AAC.3
MGNPVRQCDSRDSQGMHAVTRPSPSERSKTIPVQQRAFSPHIHTQGAGRASVVPARPRI